MINPEWLGLAIYQRHCKLMLTTLVIYRHGRMYLLTLPNILATEINLNFVLRAMFSACVSMQCSSINTFMEFNYCNSVLQHKKSMQIASITKLFFSVIPKFHIFHLEKYNTHFVFDPPKVPM